ncbi:HIT family protein [Ktedonobacter sp. SOSP1-52]|uniref:HIT family protein n=1 Tax=Ktedonobacter sp. SOSP1-52 TaxID=2778366 RepID=UPI001916B542|nr:HIT family protein [Ktedonobacter sp. SOSP1-52]GHO70943.1 HIT family protein [Ktedonobacter sp. SOSP1-52]
MSISEQQEACFVCQKHKGQLALPGGIIYEDELIFASHHIPEDGPTSYLGWLIVEPKRHFPGLAEQTEEEAKASGLLIARLSRALKVCTEAEHIYSFVLGHHVPHLHIHLLPRYPGTPRDYWGVRVPEWPDAPQGDAQHVVLLCERVRDYLITEEEGPSFNFPD